MNRIGTLIPDGRLDSEPAPSGPPTREELDAALRLVLRGVDLGTHDERLIDWAAHILDVPTVLTIASWIERARRDQYVAYQDRVTAVMCAVFVETDNAMHVAATDAERLAILGHAYDRFSHEVNGLLDLHDEDGNVTAYVTEDAPRLAAEQRAGEADGGQP